MNFDFFALINVDVNQHFVVGRHIFTLHDINTCILESFFLEIALNDAFGPVYNIGSYLVSNVKVSKSCLNIFTLRLLYSGIGDTRDLGLRSEAKMQVYGIAYDAVGPYLYV